MEISTKKQYKRHKLYRWIALFIKIFSIPSLQYVFYRFKGVIVLPLSHQSMALSAFLSTLTALIIYYGVIFILDRKFNFHSKAPLGKSIRIYAIVVLILLTIESVYSVPLQNMLYRATHFGLKDPSLPIIVSNVKAPLIYLLLGFGVQFAFSLVTSVIIFNLFRFVLNQEPKKAKHDKTI
ncbi:MAG: hypothetical protein MJ207_02800 [Bacilli bacterium]|nr:hypothetical protein [Bacilli bacterium]MCQ2794270.1 hypothetical protein [Bacilli bacterium]